MPTYGNNVLGGGITTLIAKDTIQYLRAKSATLGRIHVENRQEMDITEGGDTVNIRKPATIFTPTAVSYTAAATPQVISIPYVPLTFSNHYEVNVAVNMLESRYQAGNMTEIIDLAVPGQLDGLVRMIDASVCQLYSGSAVSPAGAPGQLFTDQTFRNAIGSLAANNVYPEMGNVYMVFDPQVYYRQVVGNPAYLPAYAVGDNTTIRTGNLKTLYDCNVSYSPNIVTTVTSPVTINNLLFHRDAFVIGFVEFEAANKYGATVVEESIVTDPISGVSLRVMRYFNAGLKTWMYNIDVKWGVAVLDPNRIVVLQC